MAMASESRSPTSRAPARAALLSALLALVNASTAQLIKNAGFNLFVFGDSLSDTGNTFKYVKGQFPEAKTYWQGRWTNAPGVWVDTVRLAGLPVVNQAYGSSTACQWQGLTGKQGMVPSVNRTVAAWLGNPRRPAGKKVVTIWAGHNDLLVAMKDKKSQILYAPALTVKCILNLAESVLQKDPAAVVLVGTLEPIALTPYFKAVPLAKTLSVGINTAIKLGVFNLKLSYGSNRVHIWDASEGMSDIVDEGTSLGFKYESTDACIDYPEYPLIQQLLGQNVTAGAICKDPNSHLFYDLLHPTSRTHLYIATSLINRLTELKLLTNVPANWKTSLAQLWASKVPKK